jgi:hypothetical protein
MKRIVFLSSLLLMVALQAISQTAKDADKKELEGLLQERKTKFDAYSASLEKHSGIFGNKTKADIKNSSQVLIDIVKADNRIISTLYRVVDFRNYEKVNTGYDLQKKDETLTNLLHATDTLSKQVEVLKQTNHDLQSKSTRLQWLLFLLSALAIWRYITLWRKKSTAAES